MLCVMLVNGRSECKAGGVPTYVVHKGSYGTVRTGTDPAPALGAAARTVEFFTAQIRNPHTRAAYAAAVTRFFTWCDARGLALAELSPIAVATYIEDIQGRYRAPQSSSIWPPSAGCSIDW